MCEFVVTDVIDGVMVEIAGNFVTVHHERMGLTRLQRRREEAA